MVVELDARVEIYRRPEQQTISGTKFHSGIFFTAVELRPLIGSPNVTLPLLTPLTFARHRLIPLAAFTSGAYFLHDRYYLYTYRHD